MKILVVLSSLMASLPSFAVEKIKLTCNVVVDPQTERTRTTWRVDQFLFEDPSTDEAAVFWHPWGGCLLNVGKVQPTKLKVISRKADSFPGTFTFVLQPEAAGFQFKVRLTQTSASGPDFSLVETWYGMVDKNNEVLTWVEFGSRELANNNQFAGACRYNF